jgi:hypothetical protein
MGLSTTDVYILFSGDTELNEYMDSLARDPDKFIRPHNADTGETILHLLAKEGKMEILHNLLEDARVEKDLVRALLQQVLAGWVSRWYLYFQTKNPNFGTGPWSRFTTSRIQRGY